jgi:hypothetical protein
VHLEVPFLATLASTRIAAKYLSRLCTVEYAGALHLPFLQLPSHSNTTRNALIQFFLPFITYVTTRTRFRTDVNWSFSACSEGDSPRSVIYREITSSHFYLGVDEMFSVGRKCMHSKGGKNMAALKQLFLHFLASSMDAVKSNHISRQFLFYEKQFYLRFKHSTEVQKPITDTRKRMPSSGGITA